MGCIRSWEECSLPGSRSPSCLGMLAFVLCSPEERPRVHTWVELEAGTARSVVNVIASGQRCTQVVHFSAIVGHVALSWRLDIALEPSIALSLRPHRAE